MKLGTDGTSDGPEGSGAHLREKFWLGPVFCLGGAFGCASGHKAVDPGSTPGLGENVSLRLTTLISWHYTFITYLLYGTTALEEL